tara:strand:- start:112 stop:609 length:498 start_codon:yes stop_codon:yes gene_type:complete
MKILIKPEDIVKRCLWDNYVYYIVGSNKEAEKVLLKNEEIEISEKDAFVIGLLKIMETENLIHRFNMDVAEFITNKSSIEKVDGEKLILLKKKAFDYMISKYLDKFPDYWTPDNMYRFNLKELVEYISKFQDKLETLKTETIEFQNFKNDYYFIKDIKKMLKFNY